MPRGAQDEIAQLYCVPWRTKGGDAWPDWLNIIDDFCSALGPLLGGAADEFCPLTNVSDGFFKCLSSLTRREDPLVVVMDRQAFPSMGFVANALSDSGVVIKFVDTEKSEDVQAAWAAAMTPEVGAALITHVHSNTGFISPVTDISKICREQNIVSIVDIAQSVGVIPIDLKNWAADVVLGSCVKWLCGGPGAGFIWVRGSSLDLFEPENVGWFSHENPFEFKIDNFLYAKTAKRFWGGTPSIAPFAFAQAGIKLSQKIGVETIRAHNLALKEIVSSVLPATAVQKPERLTSDDLGGTLCVTLNKEYIDQIDAALTARHCHFDRRGETLRLSFHIYNTAQEAELVRDILSENLAIGLSSAK